MNENKKGIVPTLAISCEDFEKITNRLEEQEKEIEELKAKLEMYENGVYFSSENDKLQERIDKAIEYIEEHNIIGTNKEYLPNGIEKCYSLELMEILQGSDKDV